MQDEVRRALFRTLGAERFPDPPPLNLKVLSKRAFLEYEEWTVEYDVETAATMPAEAGWRVPACLLVPELDHPPGDQVESGLAVELRQAWFEYGIDHSDPSIPGRLDK